MANAFPFRPSVDHTPRSESALVFGDDDSNEILEALASDTAREIVKTLSDGPATASDVADAAETSLQNAHYHLTNLQAAGLITEAGTWYSEKGKEMTVFALTSERLEIRFAADSESASSDAPQSAGPESSPRPVASTSD